MDSGFIVPEIFLWIFVSVVGLCLGSFATALIYRIPRGIPWTYNSSANDKACRSQCPQCGEKLEILDLIPFFSWVFLRGKCRHCGVKIPARYPLTELITMLLVLSLYWVWGFTASAFPLFFAVPLLIAALVIDWETMILPDSINISLVILSAIYTVITWQESGWDITILADHVIAAVVLVGIFALVSFMLAKLKGREALGLGDLKFLGPAGLFLGTAAIPSFMALSGALGLITAVLKRKSRGGGVFPFGPALIISLYIHVFLTGLGFDYKW